MSDNQFDDAVSKEMLAFIKGERDDLPSKSASLFSNNTSASTETTQTPETPKKDHRHGHRARLRERFVKGGSSAMADYELLELLLFTAIPRKDVKPLAKTLIKTFGSFGDVLNASIDQLSSVKGVSETTAATLKVVQACSHKLLQEQVINKNVISSWQALLDYCTAVMGVAHKEQFRILFLNKKNHLIADEVQQEGTIDHTPVYPREVIKRALELHATAIILVHNHPSGDPTPSQADIDMTNAIVSAGKTLGITVHDHIIIARNDYTSFKKSGLL